MSRLSDHQLDLLELVGTHGWRALLREKENFLRGFHATVRRPAVEDFDFIRKEVATGVIREMDRFFDGIEQELDNLAQRKLEQDSGTE